jgi:hypothetical protein
LRQQGAIVAVKHVHLQFVAGAQLRHNIGNVVFGPW